MQQAFLNSEKNTLKELEELYKDALADINAKLEALMGRQDADMQNVIYQVEYQKSLKTQVQAVLEQLQANEFETLSDYLTNAYTDGFVGTMYDMHGQDIPLIVPIDQKQVIDAIQHDTKLKKRLYDELGLDINQLKKQIASEISRGISTGLSYGEIARNISDYAKIPKNRAMTIARTEAHRIQIQSTADAQKKAKAKGADVVKQWDATLDGDTRKSHRKLDGQIRELDEPFEVNGKKVMHPGGFGRPEEDINCRCALLQRARWALDDKELQTLKERADYFELDKTEDFEEFKKKYLKVLEKDLLLKYDLQFFSVSDEEQKEKAEEFKKLLEKGEVNTNLRWRKQAEHVEGTKEHEIRLKEDAKNGKTSVSVFYKDVDIKSLIDEYSTKGEMVFLPNQQYPIEYVSVEKSIGKVYNIGKGKYEETDRIAIRYSGKGIHIHPVKRK